MLIVLLKTTGHDKKIHSLRSERGCEKSPNRIGEGKISPIRLGVLFVKTFYIII